MPNSSRFVFPAIMAPAVSNCSTTVAFDGLANRSRMPEPHVVGKSRVHMLSFTEIKWPSSRDLDFPEEQDVRG